MAASGEGTSHSQELVLPKLQLPFLSEIPGEPQSLFLVGFQLRRRKKTFLHDTSLVKIIK